MAVVAAALAHDWSDTLRSISTDLRRLGVSGLAEQAYSAAIGEQLRAHLAGLEDDDFTSSMLPGAIYFVSAVLLHFLAIVLGTRVSS